VSSTLLLYREGGREMKTRRKKKPKNNEKKDVQQKGFTKNRNKSRTLGTNKKKSFN